MIFKFFNKKAKGIKTDKQNMKCLGRGCRKQLPENFNKENQHQYLQIKVRVQVLLIFNSSFIQQGFQIFIFCY